MIRVVCVKQGDKYGAEYVLRLRAMVARCLLQPHNFVCLTDKPVDGITCEPLPSELQGWWAKIGLFKPGVLPGVNLYFDLDVVATGPINLPPLGQRLWALDDFSYGLRVPHCGVIGEETRRLLGGEGTVNSSVMYWEGGVADSVWERFTPAVMQELHGDQNWITRCLWPDKIDLFPVGFACSYKYHILMGGGPPAPIVVFHGDPKPAMLPPWEPLRKLWSNVA